MRHNDVQHLVTRIETPHRLALNAPKVCWIGTGAEDKDVLERHVYMGI